MIMGIPLVRARERRKKSREYEVLAAVGGRVRGCGTGQ